jgi:hypothetical protein
MLSLAGPGPLRRSIDEPGLDGWLTELGRQPRL